MKITLLTPLRFLGYFVVLASLLGAVTASRAVAAPETPGAPDLVLQRGHSGTVNAVAFATLQGRRLAVSAGNDGTVRLFDIRARLLCRVLRGSGEPLTCLATFADSGGDPVIVAGGKTSVYLWNGRTGAVMHRLLFPVSESFCAIRAVAVSPDGGLLAAATDETEDVVLEGKPAPRFNVRVWNTQTGKLLAAWLAHPNGVNAVAFSRDSQTLWTAGGMAVESARSGKEPVPLTGWNGRTGKRIQSLAGFTNTVLSLALSPDGKTLAAGGANRVIRLFDAKAKSATVRAFAATTAKGDVDALTWIRGNTHLVSTIIKSAYDGGSENEQWQIAAGKIAKITDNGSAWYNETLTASPTDAFLLSRSENEVSVWDNDRKLITFPGVQARAQDVSLSANGRYIAAFSITASPRQTGRRPTPAPARALDIWNTADASLATIVATPYRASITDPDRDVVCFGFAPNESLLAIGEEQTRNADFDNKEGIISVVDPATGERLFSFPAVPQAPNAVAWSPDGKTLVSGGGNGVLDKPPYFLRWWNRETRTQIRAVERNRPAEALAVSPDGRTLAVGDRASQRVFLYDMATGKNMGFLPAIDAGGSVRALAFSPDGAFLAWGGYERSEFPLANVAAGRTLLLWRIALGENQKPVVLSESSETVNTVAWTPNSRYLLAGDETGNVGVFDAATGKRVSQRLTDTENQGVAALAVSPDNKRMYVANFSGGLTFWALSPNVSETPRPVISVYPVGTNGFLMINPQGFYRVARQSTDAVGFRRGGVVYPFDTFDAVYNRPDKVIESVGGDAAQITAFRNAYEKRLARQGKTFAPPPGVRVRVGTLPLYTDNPKLTFPVSVSTGVKRDDRRPRVRVRVNGVPVPDTVVKATGTAPVSVELTSGTGEATGWNRLDLFAATPDGAESLPETVYVFYNADDPAKRDYLGENRLIYTYTPEPHDLYVLTVGVSSYADAAYNLRYAAADAVALGDFFEKASGSFRHTHRLTLTDAEGTKAGIVAASGKLFAEAKPNDTVIIFLAGHGLLTASGDYFFATHDIAFDRPQTGGLAYGAIERLLAGCAARNRLLLMDTCHAGEVDPAQFQKPGTTGDAVKPTVLPDKATRGMAGQVPPAERGANSEAQAFALMGEAFADLRRGSGTQVIAASGGTEFAWEEKGHGVFTAAMLEGLYKRKADANADGAVSVAELRDYVSARVSELTRGQQRPVARAENAEFDFAVF